MIKAVIFDMDGLMIDTEPIQSQAFAAVLRAYGKEPSINANGLVHEVGVRGDRNFRAMKKKYNIDEDVLILRKKRRIAYEELLQNGVSPLPGLLHLLHVLKQKKIKLAIASGSPRKHIMLILDHVKITDYFDVIISGEDVTEGKPNPECFIKASNQLKIPIQECLVLEDAESGIKGAKQIGMKTIAIPSSYTKHHEFILADKICTSLEEITVDLLMRLE